MTDTKTCYNVISIDTILHIAVYSLGSFRQSVQMVDFSPFSSSVVTGTEMRVVWAWIPERFALFSPVRLFSTAEHGRSLAT